MSDFVGGAGFTTVLSIDFQPITDSLTRAPAKRRTLGWVGFTSGGLTFTNGLSVVYRVMTDDPYGHGKAVVQSSFYVLTAGEQMYCTVPALLPSW